MTIYSKPTIIARPALLLASLFMISGCQVATVPSYQIPSHNIIKLKKELSDKTLAIGNITLAKNVNTHMLCRLSGPIVLPANVNMQEYLKDGALDHHQNSLNYYNYLEKRQAIIQI